MFVRRRVAERNLALCFPELDSCQREQLLRAHFRSLGIGVFEFLRAWWGRLTPMSSQYRLQGMEHLERARAAGRGVILVSPHFTTLEICVRLLTQNVPLAGMYRPHDSAALEWAVRRARSRYTQAMFARDELRPAIRHLKSGGVLWFAPDQETRRGESVFVPFFGQPAWSLTSTHQLARLTRSAVLPLFHQRLDDGSYALEIGPELEDFPSQDATADTARVIAALEGLIRRCPEQYLWVHQRFKRQPEGRASAYQ
jgi:KDO2-lipid IV(A) lauroyltransferase